MISHLGQETAFLFLLPILRIIRMRERQQRTLFINSLFIRMQRDGQDAGASAYMRACFEVRLLLYTKSDLHCGRGCRRLRAGGSFLLPLHLLRHLPLGLLRRLVVIVLPPIRRRELLPVCHRKYPFLWHHGKQSEYFQAISAGSKKQTMKKCSMKKCRHRLFSSRKRQELLQEAS